MLKNYDLPFVRESAKTQQRSYEGMVLAPLQQDKFQTTRQQAIEYFQYHHVCMIEIEHLT